MIRRPPTSTPFPYTTLFRSYSLGKSVSNMAENPAQHPSKCGAHEARKIIATGGGPASLQCHSLGQKRGQEGLEQGVADKKCPAADVEQPFLRCADQVGEVADSDEQPAYPAKEP